ncbi:MAG TPA: hypothetical protein VMU54_18845 [Planctomycetota bacterium]|nr:hypothetical protein [Planctomycetota bacterium]
MPKLPDGAVLFLLSVLAVGLLSALIGLTYGPTVVESVIVLFALSALGGVAFMMGRSHARSRRERRNAPPPSDP